MTRENQSECHITTDAHPGSHDYRGPIRESYDYKDQSESHMTTEDQSESHMTT